MDPNDFEDEMDLLRRLKSKDVRAFGQFYRTYSEDLLILAFSLLEDAALAMKTVDELFEQLWIEPALFDDVDPPIHRYLYTEVKKRVFRRVNKAS